MFTVQSQEVHLQLPALQALCDLKKSSISHERLQDHLNQAVQFLTETSTQINDCAYAERSRYSKKTNKRIANGEAEDVYEREENDVFQEKVKALTNNMDTNMRRTIDDKIWLEDLPTALDHVRQNATNASCRNMSSQAPTQLTEQDMDLDEAVEASASQPLAQPDASNVPTTLLDAAFSTNKTKWALKSLTDRYSKHNDYVGWYRMVYDANHPGENPPPMPHPSMWFAEEENRSTETATRHSQIYAQSQMIPQDRRLLGDAVEQSGSESDVEISAERITIKCPITLLPFKDPVASTICPHAFERSAIRELFKYTNDYLPYTSEQLLELSQCRAQERSKKERQIRVPMVRCPECTVALSEKDLRPDPVLLRRVNRVLQKEKRAEEAAQRQGMDVVDAEYDDDDDDEEGDGDDIPRGTQRRNLIQLGSSPARSIRRRSGRPVKNERQSVLSTMGVNEGIE